MYKSNRSRRQSVMDLSIQCFFFLCVLRCGVVWCGSLYTYDEWERDIMLWNWLNQLMHSIPFIFRIVSPYISRMYVFEWVKSSFIGAISKYSHNHRNILHTFHFIVLSNHLHRSMFMVHWKRAQPKSREKKNITKKIWLFHFSNMKWNSYMFTNYVVNIEWNFDFFYWDFR